jgi:serine/threonine protein kinase
MASQAAVAAHQQVMEVGLTRVVLVKELAHGGFSTVYLVHDRDSVKKAAAGGGQGVKQYALKQILCQTKEQEEEAHDELRYLRMFSDHENIISLLDHSSL